MSLEARGAETGSRIKGMLCCWLREVMAVRTEEGKQRSRTIASGKLVVMRESQVPMSASLGVSSISDISAMPKMNSFEAS